jgi:hypothetical protein
MALGRTRLDTRRFGSILYNFWVDTCCINKLSNRKLSEAINSMFRWYLKAAKYYVYLTDVSTNDPSDQSL